MIGAGGINRVRPLIRKEFDRVLFSYWGLVLVPIMVAAGYTPTHLGWESLGQQLTLGYLVTASTIPPIAAILFTYRAIRSEVTNRTLVLLLALPLNRTEILVSKLVGRGIAVCTLAFVSYLIIGVIGIYRHGWFDVHRGVLIAVLSAVAIFVASAAGIAISGSFENRQLGSAAAYMAILFAWGRTLWNQLMTRVYVSVTSIAGTPRSVFGADPIPPGRTIPHADLFLLRRLHPLNAYNVLTNWILGVGNSDAGYQQVLILRTSTIDGPTYLVDSAFSTSQVPVFLSQPFSLVILALWGVIPLSLSLAIVNRRDIR
jgi:ABC-2 type transport system permease protein